MRKHFKYHKHCIKISSKNNHRKNIFSSKIDKTVNKLYNTQFWTHYIYNNRIYGVIILLFLYIFFIYYTILYTILYYTTLYLYMAGVEKHFQRFCKKLIWNTFVSSSTNKQTNKQTNERTNERTNEQSW